MSEELGITPSDGEARLLVKAATRFADPFPWRGRDALLPAHRWDLRQEFFRRALSGSRADDELLAIAWELAPSPDAHPPSGRCRFGARPATYGEAKQAFDWLHRHRKRRGSDPNAN